MRERTSENNVKLLKMMLRTMDWMPNEPVIKHPFNFVWASAYADFYLPEMWLYGVAPPLRRKDDPKKPPPKWFEARDEALRVMSLEEYGAKDDDPCTPKTLLKLMKRPNHSNFPECDDCCKWRVQVCWPHHRQRRALVTLTTPMPLHACAD